MGISWPRHSGADTPFIGDLFRRFLPLTSGHLRQFAYAVVHGGRSLCASLLCKTNGGGVPVYAILITACWRGVAADPLYSRTAIYFYI